jgi:hypothetical protein
MEDNYMMKTVVTFVIEHEEGDALSDKEVSHIVASNCQGALEALAREMQYKVTMTGHTTSSGSGKA